MDRQHIRDTLVIERYLQGKLSAAEEERFEEAYLADPELLAELKLAERLREGFKELPLDTRAPAPAPRARWFDFATSPRYGIAASLVAAVALLASGVLYLQGPGGGPGSFTAASRTRVVSLVAVRGGGNPNTVAAPAADEWTVFTVDTGLGDYDRYRVALVRADGREVVSFAGMTPSGDGTVALGFPGTSLAAGDYEVRLAGRKLDWAAERPDDELSRTPLTIAPAP
jgi:hypothetical protein